jgi:3-methyladenine DNA glycosylase AlkC
MPLDPALLRARAAEAAAKFAIPEECAACVHRLLHDYADRTRRVSPKLAEITPPNTLKTPAPVMRAVIGALRKPAQAAPEDTLGVAKRLWDYGSVEERRMAAELLGLVVAKVPGEALALMEDWLPQLESGESADALAQHAFRPLVSADPFTHLANAQRWVRHANRWIRRFGIVTLSALAYDRRWDDVPGALDVLRPVMVEADPLVRQALITALSDLLPRSPADVITFLHEHAGRQNHNTHIILRAVLKHLPAEAQTELVRLMRA